MKTIFTIFLILLCFDYAQGQDLIISSWNSPTIKKIPSSDTISINKKPNSLHILSNPLVKKGTNGNGFDLYQSQIDQMYVIIPDQKNNTSTYMPNAIGNQNIYSPDPKLKNRLDSLYRNK